MIFRHFRQVEIKEKAARRNQPKRQQQVQAEQRLSISICNENDNNVIIGRTQTIVSATESARLCEIKRLHLVHVD